MGDPEGDTRRALRAFPFPKIAASILEKYFVPGGIPQGKPFRLAPLYSLKRNTELDALTVTANFVEVFLAKEGHSGVVGVNFLEKIQLPHLASIYGVMLAGVDYVLMGAGIPRDIPGVLDLFAAGEPASLKIAVEGAEPGTHKTFFDPKSLLEEGAELPKLKRPKFLAIVSSAVLAKSLATKASGRVDGFIVETSTAGGHNAPPRGKTQLNERGEPIYGAKDEVDPADMKALGLPFWLAGSYGTPEGLEKARASGATGIQVGTAFAYARESGMDEKIRAMVWKRIQSAKPDENIVFTDPLASPTGFPFKVVQTPDTISEEAVYQARPRKCDLGYLREAAALPDGRIVYRCASEPIEVYLKKGGLESETVGRKCLCNALMATIGMAQTQDSGYVEDPVVTSGDDIITLRRLNPGNELVHSAGDVMRFLTGGGLKK
jgi:NAD(P)H-dependent flavin oxidoreductase YrpB (nitropropane dioxygenase family)